MDRILVDIVCILSKVINFWVTAMCGNNGMSYEDEDEDIETVVAKCFYN